MTVPSIRGSIIAITGGGRGIGLATARALLAEGAKVAIGDIDLEVATRAAEDIGAEAFHLDVRDKQSFSQFIQAIEKKLGPVDVLVNNAGIMPMGAFLDEDDGITDAQIDINFKGIIHGMKLVLPGMLKRGNGQIVNVASLAGRFPIPGASVYCGTKFAVCGMTEAVREEVRDSGVQLSLVLPSRVSTELVSGTQSGSGLPTVAPEEVANAIVQVIRHRLPEITCPGYLRPISRIFSVVPQWLESSVRRLIKDDRILTNLDTQARAGYVQRLSTLTPQSQKKAKRNTKATQAS